MNRPTALRAGLALALAAAAAVPVTAQATLSQDGPRAARTLFATDDSGNLLQPRSNAPRSIDRTVPITGLPSGVSLAGIDFRPATGDLYGVGSDSVVYRVNPNTAIAVAEGPAFTPMLRGASFGVDFNPVVDKIRLTSDANQNQRLDPDPGSTLAVDPDLNPGDPSVVGSAYTNSSFSATRPTATKLYAVDSASDTLFVQDPATGALSAPLPLGIDVGQQAGFDIAGAANTGFLVTAAPGRRTTLYRVDLTTGQSVKLGLVGDGRSVITGLAAWQDPVG